VELRLVALRRIEKLAMCLFGNGGNARGCVGNQTVEIRVSAPPVRSLKGAAEHRFLV
jgi:hypothetical protein